MKEYDDVVVSANVIDMFTVANEFCIFTEEAEQYQMGEVLQYYVKICPLLYLKGAILPVVEADDEYYGERFVNEDQWESVFNTLRAVLGGNDDFYSLAYESQDNVVLKASVSEHLADVYQDLKDFVLLYQKNYLYAKRNAVYECGKLFRNHWGPRIAALLPAMHSIVFGKERNEEGLD